MENMKRTLLRCLPALLAAALCAGFTSCGDDDKELTPSYETPEASSGSATPTPEQQIIGKWQGKGTNDDGKSCSMTLSLKNDGKGSIIASSSGAILVRFLSSYTYRYSTLTLNADNGDTYELYVNSLTTTSMELSFYDGPDKLQTTYYLTKTEDYSDGGDSGGTSGEAEIEKAYTLIVTWSKYTGKYSSSNATYYKRMSTTGKYTLYRNSNGTGEIGIASSNNLSTWGGIRVSGYDYVYRDVSLNSSTYYFFN